MYIVDNHIKPGDQRGKLAIPGADWYQNDGHTCFGFKVPARSDNACGWRMPVVKFIC